MKKYIIGGLVGLLIGFSLFRLIAPLPATTNLLSKPTVMNSSNIYSANVYGSFMLGSNTYGDSSDTFTLVKHTPLFEITASDVDSICLTTKIETDDPYAYLEGHIFLKHDTQLRIYNTIDAEEDRKISFEFQGLKVMDGFIKANPAKHYAMYSQPKEGSTEAPPYNRLADFILERPIPANTENKFPVYHMLTILHHLSPNTVPEGCPAGFDSSLIAFDWDMANTHLWDTSDKTGKN